MDTWQGNPDRTGDFPGGQDQLRKSLILQVYPIAGYFGVDKGFTSGLMVLFEYAVLVAAVVLALKLIRPEISRPVAISLQLMSALASFLSPNLRVGESVFRLQLYVLLCWRGYKSARLLFSPPCPCGGHCESGCGVMDFVCSQESRRFG